MMEPKYPPQTPIMMEIQRLADARGKDLTTLAKAAGLSGDTLTKARKRGADPNARSIQKLLDYLKVAPGELIPAARPSEPAMRGEIRPAPARRLQTAPMTKDLKVMGTAAGSAINNGFEMTEQITEYVGRPPGLVGVPDAYAIYVVGESMSPLHRPGDLCPVHPYRPYKRGDSIIIQVRTHIGEPLHGYIKIFKRETEDKIVVEQINPKAELTFMKSTVVSVHKVMTMNELLSA
jgi:transcriptional regulator with XRE-family HTH domain